MIELIIISLCTLAVTGVCAFLAESLTSVSHNRLTELVEHGSSAEQAAAKIMLEWKRDIHTPKTAIFLVDLLVYTIGCVSFGGYAVARLTSIEIGAVALSATVVLMLFGHLLPRAFGERYAASTVVFTVRATSILLLVMMPLVRVVHDFFRWIAPQNPDDEETAREEIDEILETAREDGSLDAGEYRILKNIMSFTDVQVSDVMTPRTVVFSCHADLSVKLATLLPEFRQYSRFPVRETDDLDSVVGYVLAKDVLWAMIYGQTECKLRDVMREVYFVPENIGLDRALQNFLGRREHLFVVVDEYGGVEGLLTMEDVMETILGVEILDEADKITNLREFAKERRDQRIAALRAQNAQIDTNDVESDAKQSAREVDRNELVKPPTGSLAGETPHTITSQPDATTFNTATHSITHEQSHETLDPSFDKRTESPSSLHTPA